MENTKRESRQANNQAKLSMVGAKLTYNTVCYHARHGYLSRRC